MTEIAQRILKDRPRIPNKFSTWGPYAIFDDCERQHYTYCYDKNGGFRAILDIPETIQNIIHEKQSCSIPFAQFLGLTKYTSHRWIILDRNTVAILVEDIEERFASAYEKNYDNYHLYPEIITLALSDIMYTYDITGWRAAYKLYKWESERVRRAITTINYNADDALQYAVDVAKAAIDDEIKRAQQEIDIAIQMAQKL